MKNSTNIKSSSTGIAIGDNIKRALRKRGKTQRWLANKLNVAPQHVNKWCNNTNKPSSEYLNKIADALDYKVREILTGSFIDEMRKPVNPKSEYDAIIEDEKRSIRSKLDIISSDSDLSDKQKEAYKDTVMEEIDMIIRILT